MHVARPRSKAGINEISNWSESGLPAELCATLNDAAFRFWGEFKITHVLCVAILARVDGYAVQLKKLIEVESF